MGFMGQEDIENIDKDTHISIHEELLALANRSVDREHEKVKMDPQRPIFHVTAKAFWMNDPNGACKVGDYFHLFFQHGPYSEKGGHVSWGHVKSKDLVYWEHQDIALTPQPGLDVGGVFSGCCIPDFPHGNDKKPTIFYTAIRPSNQFDTKNGVQFEEQYQVMAIAEDSTLTQWQKSVAPLISPAETIKKLSNNNQVIEIGDCFRDPFVWRENEKWYMVIGIGTKARRGNALLFAREFNNNTSEWEWNPKDLLGEEFEGRNWECCNLFELPCGNTKKHVLIISPEYDNPDKTGKVTKYVLYSIGKFDTEKLKFCPDAPGNWQPLDLGGAENFYAPHTFTADFRKEKHRILWGWVRTETKNSGKYRWNGALTLPRTISLDKEGKTLLVSPFRGLEELRLGERNLGKCMVGGIQHYTTYDLLHSFTDCKSTVEVIIKDMEYTQDTQTYHGCPSIEEAITERPAIEILYKCRKCHIRIGPRKVVFDENEIKELNIFIDKRIIELYIDNGQCMTVCLPEAHYKEGVLCIGATDGTLTFTATAWKLKTIWVK